MIKILHISTFQKGGASIAAIRLHRALITNRYDSKFLFLECKESKTFFKYKKRSFLNNLLFKLIKKYAIPLSLDEFRIKKYKDQFETFSFAKTPYTKLHDHPLVKESDIINLHFVANFIDHQSFFKNVKKPIVWTLHDMQPFQGGFHYKEDEIRNKELNELNGKQYAIKEDALSNNAIESMTVVAPSQWLLDLSKKSKVLGSYAHKLIPYGINTDIFKVRSKADSKNTLGLSNDKINILFVAESLNNRRKGFEMIFELIKDETISLKCHFMAVGKVKKSSQIHEIQYFGTISDEREMSVIYNAADIFMIPSREDNLPNTMIESLCCGTPVVGFSIGGLNETITNYENGMLGDTISISELKKSLMICINNIDQFDRVKISSAAHLKYASDMQFKSYLRLYKECLEHKNVKS